MSASLASIDALFELTRHRDAPADRADVLIEVPHGATETVHFEELRNRLIGTFPADLRSFFYVNTDVGAPECAAEIARRLSSFGYSVWVLRCLIPRTFIDVNRRIDPSRRSEVVNGLTPGLPSYVSDPRDAELLQNRHARYQAAARTAFDAACGQGGLGLILHTYAPRSVAIDRIDGDIVRRLRVAYSPEQLERWPERPTVDVISRDHTNEMLAPEVLVEDLKRRYAASGIIAAENATYRLHPDSAGFDHARRYPEQVLCLEFNRATLGAPWVPFEPFTVCADGVEALSAPVVEAADAWLKRRS